MSTNTNSYNLREYLAYLGAMALEDKKAVFVGTGLPIIAAMLAQKTHAPHLLIMFEAGGIGPYLPELPISVGESRTFHKGLIATSMHDIMSLSQQGYINYGFLGAAQMDRYGNINTTVIGEHDHPTARLPGSGGANDVGSFCHRTIIIMRQDRRKFAAQLDFLTTPGYLTGPGARERAGLPADTGPHRVITQLGVYGFDDATKTMRLLAVHPGVTVDEVQANSSFPIPVVEPLDTSLAPTAEERRILREIDPTGLLIK